MSSNLGVQGGTDAPPPPPTPSTTAPPPAARARRAGWRDPRLWVGIVIVAASVLLGARVLGSADDTVGVWAVRGDVAPGERLAAADLVTQRVQFADEADLDRYFTVAENLPEELVTSRGLGAGELLPRAAVGDGSGADTTEISVPVPRLRMPPAVGPGSVVDVYVFDASSSGDQSRASDEVTSGDGSGRPGRDAADDGRPALLALDEVSVVAAPQAGEGLTGSGDRQLVLAVPSDEVGGFYDLLDSMVEPVLSIGLRR